MNADEVKFDLDRMDHGDKEIWTQFELLRSKVISKGLPYVELAKSKTFGTIKYLLKEYPNGTVEITDLDTSDTFTYSDDPANKEPKKLTDRERIQQWIKSGLR